MFRRHLAFLAIVLFALTSAARSYADVAHQENPTKKIEMRLKQEELKVSLCGDAKNQEEIALLNLQLEQARNTYATNLSLNAEGIVAESTVSKSQQAYEQIQIKLAGKCKRVRDALRILAKERAAAVAMAEQYRKELAAAGETPM